MYTNLYEISGAENQWSFMRSNSTQSKGTLDTRSLTVSLHQTCIYSTTKMLMYRLIK